jgi:membrane protease subunit HflK
MLVPFFKKIGVIFSLNDPKWGRGGSQDKPQEPKENRKPEGPPDLDQLWRDFNQRISRFFKKDGGDSGGGGYGSDMKGAGIGATIIIAIVVFLWLCSGFFSVQEGQVGVVMTFGKPNENTAPAGFNWRWPYPFQSHEIVNVAQVRTVEVGYRNTVKSKVRNEALMLTEDENIVDIQFAVQYSLKDAQKWLFNNRNQEEAVKQVAETAIREVVGKNKMDFVLYEGRSTVATNVAKSMQKILDNYESGVEVREVTMQSVQPPEDVQAAFDDAVKAGQDKERQKSEGQAYANDVIPRASGAASRVKQEAEAYRASVIANAEGDVARFKQVLVEYSKAPAVTRDRMYLDTMQQIFANTTKIMVDAKAGNNLLYLPLDKMMTQSNVGDSANNKSTTASGTAANTGSDASQSSDAQRPRDARARDGRDSRDRESR